MRNFQKTEGAITNRGCGGEFYQMFIEFNQKNFLEF